MSTMLVLALAALPPVGTPLLPPPSLESAPPAPPPVGSAALVAPLPLAEVASAQTAPSGAEPALSAAVASADVETGAEPRRPWVGAQLDAGLPEGFGASLLLRPWYFVRAHLGGVSNTASGGIRGGITLVPFHFYFTPTLTGEIGHLFEGDLTGTLSAVLDKAQIPDGTLERVSYTFFSAHLGLEIGAPDRFIVYLRGGVSRVEATFQGVAKTSGNTTVDPGEVHLGLTIPSAKVGILVYF